MEQKNRVIKNYWIAGFPYFESTAFFIPQDINENYNSYVKMKLYDQDGDEINNVKLTVNSGNPLLVNMENFMGDCKPESGMKYCLLSCETDAFISSYVRLQTKKMGAFECELQEFNERKVLYYPICFTKKRASVLVLANQKAKEEVKINMRVLKGNRAPERNIILKPLSSRIVFLQNLFDDILNDIEGEDVVQAHLKLSVPNKEGFGAISSVGSFVFDYFEGNDDEGKFVSLA